MLARTRTAAYRADVITPGQIRAARALVDWKQTDLAQASGVSEIAIKNVERGKSDPRMSTINKLQRAFDRAGVLFVDEDDVRGVGVRLKNRTV